MHTAGSSTGSSTGSDATVPGTLVQLAVALGPEMAARIDMDESRVESVDPRWREALWRMHEEVVGDWPDYRFGVFERRLSGDDERPHVAVGLYIPWGLACCVEAHTWKHEEDVESIDHLGRRRVHERDYLTAQRAAQRAGIRMTLGTEAVDASIRRARPVVALDVDGVLNRLDGVASAGLHRYDLVIPGGMVRSPFVRGGGIDDISVSVLVDDAVVAWVNTLVASGVEVVWATSWERAAAEVLAPACGIDGVAAGIDTTTYPPRFGDVRTGNIAAWKADALAARFAGRPLVWIDDAPGAATRNVWRHPDEDEVTLVIDCDPAVGLSVDDRRRVEAFLAGLERRRNVGEAGGDLPN